MRCPTQKYNRRVRAGRGFSLQELKVRLFPLCIGQLFLTQRLIFLQAANIPRKLAPTIGISVDPRRTNTSQESLDANVARLKEYHTRLILFPRRNGRARKGDASKEDVEAAKKGETLSSVSAKFPIVNEFKVEEAKVADVQGEEDAYKRLREARSEARLVGVREKRAKQKAEKDEAAKK